MKELPFISCKTTTYGRVKTLEESIHSFLIQDYPADKCELIIVNDYPEQKLIFDHPQVKIYNLDETFPILGEKENYAIERCNGDIIAVWDDDDLALSNHLQNIADHWREDTNIIHWETAVLFNEPDSIAITSVGNSGIAYSKDAWEKIGRSPSENAGGDMTMVFRIYELGGRLNVKMKNEQAAWFYCWGGRSYHQSGQGTDTDDRPSCVVRHSEYIESERQKGNIPTGDVYLAPKWNKDYAKMFKEHLEKLNAQ